MTAHSAAPRYKAFVSYSHAADGKLAPALQAGLERFAKPWYRMRAFRVFRDKTGLAVTPALWGSIQRALASSEFFVLLASPEAAQSPWVQQEVAFWLEHRSADTLLVVLTGGAIAWDRQTGDFDWTRTDALPRLLERRFGEEPHHLDLRWAREDTDLSVRRPRFLDTVAGLAATLRRVPLDDLIGEDVAHYQTTRRLLRVGVVLLLLLSASALYAAYQANRARDLAEGLEADRADELATARQAEEARAREAEQSRLAALERERAAGASRALASTAADLLRNDQELGTLLAVEAVQINPTPEAENVLRRALIRQTPPIILRGPGDSTVRSMEVSRDGQRALTVQEDGAVWIWSLASQGRPIVVPRDAIRYPRADQTRASFSPDGSSVLTWPFVEGGSFTERADDNPAARIWDVATGRRRHELPHRYLQHAAFSPDGRRVVTAGFDKPTVIVWDAASGARRIELADQSYEVVHAEFSRDGALLLTAGKDDTVRIRRAEDGLTIATLNVPGKTYMTAAMFSPDGRRVLTTSTDDPARVWDWQGAPAVPVAELTSHEGAVDFAEFSPDSTRLVTLARDQTARVWDVATGRLVQGLQHDEFIGGATFSPDNRWIATVSVDGLAILWEAATGRRFMEFGTHDHPRTTVAFSPDGARVITGTSWGELLLHPCDVCGTTSDLLARARARVGRGLTADERERYLSAAP
jgi:WD40 repeat protein